MYKLQQIISSLFRTLIFIRVSTVPIHQKVFFITLIHDGMYITFFIKEFFLIISNKDFKYIYKQLSDTYYTHSYFSRLMFYAITLLLEIMHIIECVIEPKLATRNTCIENQIEFYAIYQRILLVASANKSVYD